MVAQGLKYLISLRKDGLQVFDLYASGGFPSSHTAFVTAPTLLIGIRDGVDSPLFAAMSIICCIVMYDAIGVRRATGQQTRAINELADKTSKRLVTKIHSAKGHKPIEVVAGLGVGALVALAFYFWV